MYQCTICHEVNHSSRLHCRFCGTIPAVYSIIGKPSSSQLEGIEVIAAIGCQRACEHKAQRVNLKTVALDYYAD